MKKNNNQEAIDLCKKMKTLERRAFAIAGQMAGLRHRIEEVCIHNEVEIKHEFHAGGYLDKSEYIDKIVCKICGKIIKETKTIGGFY